MASRLLQIFLLKKKIMLQDTITISKIKINPKISEKEFQP